MSRKTNDVFRTSFLTMDGTLDPNNSQLFFRALQAPLNTTDNSFYSLGAAQTNDPSLRINKYDSNGQLNKTGFLYDTQFNTPPAGKFIIVAGGTSLNTLVYSQDRLSWADSFNGSTFLSTSCLAIAYDGFTWIAGGIGTKTVVYSSNGTNWLDVSGASNILTVQCSAIATNGDIWVAAGIRSDNYSGMCYSYDLVTWYNNTLNIRNIFLQGTVSCIAYNGFLWLAGGSIGIGTPNSPLAFSNDGIYWTRLNISIDECYSLCWNGSLWFAGGNYNGVARILYSIDGRVWSIANLNGSITSSVRAISWNGTVLVAGGYDATGLANTFAYSYDGITWIGSMSPVFPSLCNSITWDEITWQAVGEGGIAISSDGFTWTLNTQGSAILPQGKVITINKILPLVAPTDAIPDPTSPLIIAGGTDSITGCTINYSTNGISWKASPQIASVFGINAFITALVWNGTIWVGGFLPYSPNDPTVGYSYDGITWNISRSGSALVPMGVFSIGYGNYDGTMNFLAIGQRPNYPANILIRSSDGITWTDITPAEPFYIGGGIRTGAIQYNSTIWVLGGTGEPDNTLNYSFDGITWIKSNSGSAIFTASCNCLAWNGRIWVAGGTDTFDYTGSIVAYSSDGINWTRGTLTYNAQNPNSIAWNGSLFVMASNANIGYSYDGITWYPADFIPNTPIPRIFSVVWTGTLWVVGKQSTEDGGILLHSYNGTTWYNMYNSSNYIVGTESYVVATNRVNPYNGNTFPPPVLNQGITVPDGYGIFTSNANNLYKSPILYMNDTSGIIGINQTTGSYRDLNNTPIRGALEISGGGITVTTDTSNAVPGLYLTANNSDAGSGGRIELYDAINNYGWRIDNNSSVGDFNRLKIQSKSGGSLSSVMDIRNDSQTIGIGTVATGNVRLTVGGDVLITGNLTVNGTKNFVIDHPNPMLKDTHKLKHSCVEGPSRGETLNRWILTTSNRSCIQVLPSYSPYLNETWQFFVSAKDSFGTGYVTLSSDETIFTLTVSEDGTYSVVGVATRKDKAALTFDEKGVEYLKE